MTNAKWNQVHIAIIGAGFCGAMLTVHLVRKAQRPLKIALIEKSNNIPKGVAYSTHDPSHLLNVRAINMGAFPEDKKHFYKWLLENESVWRKLDPTFETLHVELESFLPRKIYGAYLESLFQEALRGASHKEIQIERYQDEAVNINLNNPQQLEIELLSGNKILADTAALTIGVPSNKALLQNNAAAMASDYVPNIWSKESPNILNSSSSLAHLSPEAKIIIVGSGLTMLDAHTTLRNLNYPGQIIVVSKDSHLPKSHSEHKVLYPTFIDPNAPPKTALTLLKCIRQEISKASREGIDWRGVIDALRPITISVWNQLPTKEKGKVMRWLSSVWNCHRHRVPSAYIKNFMSDIKNNRVIMISGRAHSVEHSPDKKAILRYRPKGAHHLESLEAKYILNCSGPELNIAKNNSPLLRNLLKNGIIIPDPLNLGIDATLTGEVKGRAFGRLFAAGLILFGQQFETIAVPELRCQSAQIAHHLLAVIS